MFKGLKMFYKINESSFLLLIKLLNEINIEYCTNGTVHRVLRN